MKEEDSILEFEGVSISQGGRIILSHVDFSIKKGEFVYLIGRTGSGKSSLLKTIYADLQPDIGTIRLAELKPSHISHKDIPELRRCIGIVFQDFQLFMDRSVMENLLFVLRATGWSDVGKMKRRMNEVLMRVGLGGHLRKMPHQLSGGEQQRVVIARALLNDPHIIVADEPTGNLDPEVSRSIMKLFRDINLSGTAVLMATHTHQFIEHFPGRVLKCKDGRVLDSNKETFEYADKW